MGLWDDVKDWWEYCEFARENDILPDRERADYDDPVEDDEASDGDS